MILDEMSIDKALSKMDPVEQYRLRRAILALAERIHVTFYEAADLVAQCAWLLR